ncbi:GNAT family N-acetyltransferase [Paenibacillus sp. RC67]|uniref:GNAT family N-acetyltransferase n=1 Tax=Paenibacillus sp. RC67 TaxID=3039392 RepID=UPI0024AD8922|nr:GNAT family N-acetyltransferase [Paenibacillus sp. RC67]
MLSHPPTAPKDVDNEVCELFVLRGFRKKGIGEAAIKLIFKLFPGKYVIWQLVENKAAIHFWYSVYKKQSIKYNETTSEFDGDQVIKQWFEIPKYK